jgi:hypothetical protein
LSEFKIIYTDPKDPTRKIRESFYNKNATKVTQHDAPVTKNQMKFLINRGYKGYSPKTTGEGDYLIKKMLGTLKDHPDVKKRYEYIEKIAA